MHSTISAVNMVKHIHTPASKMRRHGGILYIYNSVCEFLQ